MSTSNISIQHIYPVTTVFPEVARADVELAQRVLHTNLGLKDGERVLVITDEAFLPASKMWFEAAKSVHSPVQLVIITGMSRSGEQPPEEVLALCRNADVVILHTQFSLTHTDASKVARERGARVASLPGATLEIIRRTLKLDYTSVKTLGAKLQGALSQAKMITLTSDAGTNLTAEIRQNQVIDDNGFILSGEVGNLPAGEVFFAPLDGTANGTWIVNGAMSSENLDESITIHIKDGRAVTISGGNATKRLNQKLLHVGPDAFVVAEIGIGTNSNTNPKGKLIEAEKAYGTAHLALGNNFFSGGTNNVPIHLDGVTLSPTIALDGKIILQAEKFHLEDM